MNWFKSIFSSDGSISSKRVFGAIGFIWACVLITVQKIPLVDTLLFISAALLGLETLTSVFNKPKS